MNIRLRILLVLMSVATAAPGGPAASEVPLSSMDLSLVRQGFGKPHADLSVDNHPLKIAGKQYEHGLGTHSVSVIEIRVNGATRFQAVVGVDDDAGTGRGSLDFSVIGDGKTLWTSGVMKQGTAGKPVDVDLIGVKDLRLLVGDGGDGYDFDHADWAEARFEFAGEAPVAVPIPVTEPRIAPATQSSSTVKPSSLQGSPTAATPPMGWNSYDGYGDSVTEAETIANAKAVAELFRNHGWQYVVVDYRWYDPGAHNNDPNSRADAPLTLDRFGRLQPSPNRFPSAEKNAGFKPIADQVHVMGLKFGIHIMRGIPRLAVKANLAIAGSDLHAADAADQGSKCVWCPDMYGVKGETPAGQAWYDSIFKQYADWGLDFVKVDDLSEPYSTWEVEAIRRAIDKTGRTIVFSTSPGPAPLDRAEHLVHNANMWRATGDFWDNANQLDSAMVTCAQWNGHGGPGHWPDMDMLPVGRLSVGGRSVGPDRRTKFSHAEQVTLLTMWSIFPSPLMVGGDLTAADDFEKAVLLNDEILAVDQDPAGKPAMRAEHRTGGDVWRREMADGSIVVAMFNKTPADVTSTAAWPKLGLYGTYSVRDLWTHEDLPPADKEIVADIPARGARMFKLTVKK